GKSQIMLVSKETEIQIDQQYSPHQISSDYGILQDKALNNYISKTGMKIAAKTHRLDMPYNFKGVNATYVNAYAFPGGSRAATRVMLLSRDNEAELAALLGHELGHVNARHTAERMSKGMVIQTVVGGLAALAGTQGSGVGELAGTLGMLGAGALLASYSRDNERQADELGMEYMVRAGYDPNGMIGLMDVLNNLSKHNPNVIELMFATHPMSSERYKTAADRLEAKYKNANKNRLYKERYKDNTARLRAKRKAIENIQKGEKEMAGKKYGSAETYFKNALKKAPKDYAGLLMMSKCQLMQDKNSEARQYAEKAKAVYPKEAQAYHLCGFAKIKQKKYESAYEDFKSYEKKLPGNPNTTFFKGYSLEGMKRNKEAAEEYYKYLQSVKQGENAKHAYQRLVDWGYIKP
ncbi:MAG: M48 family metalloprotease, partial [Deltaproteobacteria bacterium]|nr:M48 family metalloprotease [Deltaproteobacteria bacterium]